MSRLNGTATRKPAGSEGREAAASELQRYSELMREMDSPDGVWNPEPDAHITALLREGIELSPNDTKFIAYVKSCCIRRKPGGRTAWGETESGKPLTAARINDYFDWDLSNTLKYAKRLLAYGFVRVNKAGVFGLGARIQDNADDGNPPSDGEEKGNVSGMYIPPAPGLPAYLATDLQRFIPSERESFLKGWTGRKEAAKKRLNDEVARLRELEQAELSEHCKAFGLTLKEGKKRRNSSEPPGHDNPANPEDTNHTAPDGPERYVHTTSVHTEEGTLYSGISTGVHTSHIRNESSKLKEELASYPSARSELAEATREAIDRSRLVQVGGKPMSPGTIGNICSHLERLPTNEEAKGVIEILESKCRFLEQRPAIANEKTWGWLVGVVKGEVENRMHGRSPQRESSAQPSPKEDLPYDRVADLWVTCRLYADCDKAANVNADHWRRMLEGALGDPGLPSDLIAAIQDAVGAQARKAGQG